MKHIYELQRIDIRGRRYPQRHTNLASMGFFSTQENAVEAMQCFLGDFTNFDYDCKYPTWLGFVVTKYGVDSGKCEPLYQCTYSHEGKFNDENLADEMGRSEVALLNYCDLAKATSWRCMMEKPAWV